MKINTYQLVSTNLAMSILKYGFINKFILQLKYHQMLQDAAYASLRIRTFCHMLIKTRVCFEGVAKFYYVIRHKNNAIRLSNQNALRIFN